MRDLLFTLFALVLCGTSLAAPAPHFVVNSVKISDLGTVGGTAAGALDVNDKNEIVGWAYTASNDMHAFFWSGGSMNDIGPTISPGTSFASGINNAGQVTGWSDQHGQQMGFLWNAGSAITLFGPVANTPPNITVAYKINDNGDICGAVNGPTEAVTWQASGPIITLPGVSVPTQAFDINRRSGMTGYTSLNKAWRWILSGGVVVQSMAVPWPAPTGYGSGVGNAINDRAAVVGNFIATAVSNRHAFFWDGRAANSVDLGVFPKGVSSSAEDLNEQRFIVGRADEQYQALPTPQYSERAFLYHTDFGMLPLPKLRATPRSEGCRAYAVNEWKSATSQLVIVGACDVPTGSRAVVWDVNVTLVP